MVHVFEAGHARCDVCGQPGTVYHWGDFRLAQSLLPDDAECVCFCCLVNGEDAFTTGDEEDTMF